MKTNLKNNKFIAEFMGNEFSDREDGNFDITFENIKSWDVIHKSEFEDGLFSYSDWNKLIPVIRKIREIINTELSISEYFDVVGVSQRLNPYDYDLESIYKGVVEFIQNYNHLKEN